MYYCGWFTAGLYILYTISFNTMTKLNIRKNIAAALVNTAAAVENAKVPTKANVASKLHDIRCRAAALVMPNDMAFIITSKDTI
jgi:hypothetical protein